jgi:hypothetical protein
MASVKSRPILSIVTMALSITVALTATAAADENTGKGSDGFEKRREQLNTEYLQQLSKLRNEYELKFKALQAEESASLQNQFQTAMRGLDLEKANRLNTQMRQIQSQTAASQFRTIFVRNGLNGERGYFLRGLNGEWIARTVNRKSETTTVYKISEETAEYVELLGEQGRIVQRLYEDRNLQLNRSQPAADFVNVGSGHWLHADTTARAASELLQRDPEVDTERTAAIAAFSAAIRAVKWKGIKNAWTEDFRFMPHGQMMTTSGRALPQRWLVVEPGVVLTINDRVIDFLTIDLEAGTLQSRVFSEHFPPVAWSTRRLDE